MKKAIFIGTEQDIEMYGFNDRLLADYFYQQAKKEGNDE